MPEFDAILLKPSFDFDSGPRLTGLVYADKKGRFNDGDLITTSKLTGHDGNIFFTKNSRYLVVWGA